MQTYFEGYDDEVENGDDEKRIEWYFKNGLFYPSFTRVLKAKYFTTLPKHTRLLVLPKNMYGKTTKLVPVSSLASAMQGVRFGFNFDNSPIAFYDIETEKDGKTFRFGIINDTRYDDPQEMVSALYGFKHRVGYNVYRFDLPVLYGCIQDKSLMGCYDLRKFNLYYIRDGIDVDLMFFVRLFYFKDLRQYGVAKSLGIPFVHVGEYNEEKCRQDVNMSFQIFWKLDVPAITKMLEQIVSVDLHILQNVFFDRFLRYIVMDEYLRNGYLPIQYPKKMNVNLSGLENLVKHAQRGEFDNVWYYDIENAYPTTLLKTNESVYLGEHNIPSLERRLLQFKGSNDSVDAVIKKLANSIIGYMNDKSNYFSNPMIWYNVVTQFNQTMQKIIDDLEVTMVWANLDGFMSLQPLTLINDKVPHRHGNYNLRLKEFFKYAKVYHVNKYVAVDSRNKVVTKGFGRVRLRGIEKVADMFKARLSETLNVEKAMIDSKIDYEKDDDWTFTIKKTSNLCTRIDLLPYWEDCIMGFNDIVMTHEQRVEKYEKWKKQYI